MIFSKSRPVKIVLVGTGGTGGYIVPQLYRLLYALDRPIRVILCDGDLVEEKNLGRQNFIEADLGKNKAMVLAERYSNAFGIETSYIPQYVEDEEMLEELLEAGFPVETAVQMMNTALVIGREEVKFCTLDVCLFDLYRGSCEFVKAGAAATFIKKKEKVEKIVSTTLPIGVIQNIEIDREVCDLESGDYVVMVTDGVLDALPAKEQEEQMIDIIQNTNIVNPTEFARSILSEVLKYSGEMPLDDMTILVIGLWGVS